MDKKIWIIGAAFIVIFVVATILNLFGVLESYQQFVAVILSAAATYVIVAITTGKQAEQQNELMERQNKSDEAREKNTKVFEEKLKIYQDFLHCLYEVIKDGEVTKEEAIQLEFQTSYITMHTTSEHIKVIASQVKAIVEGLKNENMPSQSANEAEKASENNTELMKSLFAIVEELKKELYDIQPTNQDEENIKDAVAAFSSIMEAVEIEQPTVEVTEELKDNSADYKSNLGDFTQQLIANLGVDSNIWDIELGGMEKGVYVNVAKKDNKEGVRVMLTHEENGDQYFQIHYDYDDPHEAYKHMKWTFGGRQNRWSWWRFADAAVRNLTKLEDIQTGSWNSVLAYYTKEMQKLVAYIEKFEKVRYDIFAPVSDEKAKVWMYYNDCVAFDFEKSIGERLFMDVVLEKDNLYSIMLGNRDDKAELLLPRLSQLGFNVSEKELKDCRYHPYEGLTVKQALEHIKEIDSKII